MLIGLIATLFGGVCIAFGATTLFISKPAALQGRQNVRSVRARALRGAIYE